MSSSDKNKNMVEIEYSLKRRLDYEHATVECMRTLLELGSVDDILPKVLDIVHRVVDNSRTYIFKNEIDPELGLCTSQLYEKVSNGIDPQIDNSDLQHLSYKEAAPTLFPVLESRQHFAHLVEELDDPERSILAEQGVLSVLIIPIFAGQDFWGFIGFDDCVKAREWDENDIILLKMVADGIGEFISHREAENELRESEERYKTLHNATFGGILIHDKGKILDCNQGLSDMTGYSKEELIGGDSFKIVTEESKYIVLQKLASGSEEPYEIFGLRKDGTEYPMRVQAKNIPYKGKRVRVTELRDITEQKESERALKESEERFKALHNASFGGIFIHMDGTIIDCNLGLSKMTGYTHDELIGMNGLLLIAETYRDKVINNMQTCHEESFEAVGIKKDGTEYPIYTQAKNIPYKGRNVRVVEFRDITKQKKSENELRESEQRFKALHNASFGGITIHDKGVILDCNLGLSEITGYSLDELIGMNGLLLIAESSRELVMGNILAGYEEPYEAVGLRKDGTEYPIRLEARNIPYKGKMVRVVEFRDITEQKESEKALRESEERYRLLADNTLDCIWILGLDLVFTYVNPAITKILGYTPDEWIGSKLSDHCDEKNFRKMLGFMQMEIEKPDNSEGVVFQTEAIHKEGHSVPIEIIGKVVTDDDGNPVSMQGTTRDITSRVLSEKALIKSEAILNDVSRIGKIGGWEHNFESGKTTWTQEMFEIFETEQIDNRELTLERYFPDSRKKLENALNAMIDEFKPYDIELEFISGRGNHKWIRTIGKTIVEDNKIVRYYGTVQDITESKEAEIKLKESERKFRNYLESAPYGILILDEHGNYLEVNKTVCKLTGYDENELIHMNITDLVAPESLIHSGQSFDELKARGYTFTELQLRHKDGNISWISRNGAKLSDDRFILFVSDITEKKKAEHSLIEGKMLAEHNNRIKSEFLANMSHELRTPLTAVIGFSDILQEGIAGELTEKQLGYVDHINKSGNHLLEIINDILDLSKVEAGKMELECQDFHLSKLIDETLESMNLISGKKNIKLKLINDINNGNVHADKVKVQQILYNLLSNAIKFTPENGEVIVRIERTDNRVQVSVADTGIGIAPEMQEEIFSPFTQVDASSKRKYGGTGLGLALVKKFVEMHNGKVWLESEEGKGSTFTFTIEDQKKDD